MAIVELEFKSEEKKLKAGEDKPKTPLYKRNDVLALSAMMQRMDTSKVKMKDWVKYSSICEKLEEREEVEEYDCKIQFTVGESGLLKDFLDDPPAKLLDGVSLAAFHVRTWVAIKDQLEEKVEVAEAEEKEEKKKAKEKEKEDTE